MWNLKIQLLITVCVIAGLATAVEKDIEVKCLEGKATEITEGGVIANCAYEGLTRTKTIGPWLFQLANVLQGVNASHNNIKYVSVFPVLPRVLFLTLKHNSIKQIDHLAFAGLENLQNLDLSFNRITGANLKGVLVGKQMPERYEPLPIRTLTLSNNDISSLEPGVFTHLQYLRDLYLDNNPLIVDENFSAALQELAELKLLSLTGAGLSSLPKDVFSGLQITSLLLIGNQFTQVPDLTAIGNSLRVLNINQNPIEEFDATTFSGLNSISEIVASGMPNLTIIRTGTFSYLNNIRTISCSYNPQLVDIDEKAFWNHSVSKPTSTLREVYLNNNALPRIRKNILPWLKMTRVTLDGNRWVCDCRLHWLATFVRSRNTTIDRISELKCQDPIWLNGTQIIFWIIDTKNKQENFPCEAELEEERLHLERERQEMARLENERIMNSPPPVQYSSEEGDMKLLHIVAIAGIVTIILVIGSIIAFNKYKNYRPIYNVEKVSSPMQNEMKFISGTPAEKSQLVS